MVPKNLSFSVPDRAALLLAPPLVMVSRVFRPVIAALNWLANLALRAFGVEPRDEAASTFTLEEVEGIVEQSRREGTLVDESGTLAGAFEFTDKSVVDVEVPIGAVVVLSSTASPADVQAAVVRHGFSRYVVADEHGRPVGYLHMKDVMDLDAAEFHAPIPAKRVRRLVAVSRQDGLEEALARLRRAGAHLAVTVDADGTARGLLFLEDVLEVLVGEVEDAA
jgi:CBS domain containing-hemolysin-like protein